MAETSAHNLFLRVVAPDKTVIETDVTSVTFMGEDGSYGILAHHAPLMTPTVPGVVTIKHLDGSVEEMLVTDGFAEVRNNTLSLICDEGERAEDIDLEAAVAAEKAARAKIDAMEKVDASLPKAEASLQVALLRQAIARRRSGTGHV